MEGIRFLNAVALAAAGGATAYARREEIRRSEAWKRGQAALHVLRGRPLVWRVNLEAPPVLNFSEGQQHIFVADVNLNGAHAMKIGR